MTEEEILALSDDELEQAAVAFMPPGQYGYFPTNIAAAMDLALSISDRYWMELHTPFCVGDPFFAGFTPLGTSGWNGRPDNQCEAEKPGKAITRAFVLTMTQEVDGD